MTSQCRTQGHETPQANCTCGIHASKSVDHLRKLGYAENRICGEVFLWGTVVEHAEGWRAQFAYPKSFVVPISLVPLSMGRVESWLASLSAYGCDIFIDGQTGTVPLWHTSSGVHAGGLDMLVSRSNGWYVRRAEQRQIKRGDRVAVIGYGIAVVEHADRSHVQAVLGNRNELRIGHERIVWCEQYSRWETAVGAMVVKFDTVRNRESSK